MIFSLSSLALSFSPAASDTMLSFFAYSFASAWSFFCCSVISLSGGISWKYTNVLSDYTAVDVTLDASWFYMQNWYGMSVVDGLSNLYMQADIRDITLKGEEDCHCYKLHWRLSCMPHLSARTLPAFIIVSEKSLLQFTNITMVLRHLKERYKNVFTDICIDVPTPNNIFKSLRGWLSG